MIEPITPGGFDMTPRDKRRLEQIRKLQRDNDRCRAEKFKDLLKKELEEKLKPCPFCGSTAELRDDGDEYYPYWVNCNDCTGRTGECPTKELAIDAWNARTKNG